MITLFHEAQKRKKEFFGRVVVSLFSLFSLSGRQRCLCVLLLFSRGTSFALFFLFSLYPLGNQIIRIIALYFLSLVFIHDTLYSNTHTHAHFNAHITWKKDDEYEFYCDHHLLFGDEEQSFTFKRNKKTIIFIIIIIIVSRVVVVTKIINENTKMLRWQKRRRRREEKDYSRRRNEEYHDDGKKNRLPFDGVGRVVDDDDDAIGGWWCRASVRI